MVEPATNPHETTPARANVEDSDIGLKGVLIVAGILIATIALTCWGVWVLFWGYTEQAIAQAQADQTLAETIRRQQESATLKELPLAKRLPVEPTLEGLASPPAVGNPLPLVRGLGPTEYVDKPMMSGGEGWPSLGPELKAREERELSTLRWVNEKEGIVRLPIETVMKGLPKKLPIRPSDSSRNPSPHYRTPSSANSGRPPVGAKP